MKLQKYKINKNILVSTLLSSQENAATVQVVARPFPAMPFLSSTTISLQNIMRSFAKKNIFSKNVVRFLLNTITSIEENITPSPSGEILSDMKNLPFYEVVLEKDDDSTYLVTGNIKHLPDKPNIVTARESLTILEA